MNRPGGEWGGGQGALSQAAGNPGASASGGAGLTNKGGDRHTSLPSSELPKAGWGAWGEPSFPEQRSAPFAAVALLEASAPARPAGKKGPSLWAAWARQGLPGRQSPVCGPRGHSEAQGLAGSARCQRKGALSCPYQGFPSQGLPSIALGGRQTPCSQGGLGPRGAGGRGPWALAL